MKKSRKKICFLLSALFFFCFCTGGLAQKGSLKNELVLISDFSIKIKIDLRYGSKKNFLKKIIYKKPEAYLQKPVVVDLVRVSKSLQNRGLGLIVLDAYRPYFVTEIFWKLVPSDLKKYFAKPENGSIHNRGCAIDLTLYDIKTGKEIEMPSKFDEFSKRSHIFYKGGSLKARMMRDVLIDEMKKHNFFVCKNEWWHFDHKLWKSYPVLNLDFDQLKKV